MAMSINERNEFVLSNLGLIKTITNRYDHLGNEEDREDSFHDGIVKFLEIAENYNPNKGCKLSTYIWPHIQNAVTENQTAMPAALRKNLRKIENSKEYLEAAAGHEVDDSEVAAFMGISEKKIGRYRSQAEACKPVSLTPASNSDEENDLDLLNINVENPAGTPESNFMKKEDIRILKLAWKELDEEERTILSYRTTYGTDLTEPLSLRQVADIMGSNRTTIGQKEKKATEHLKRILQEQGLCA